MTRKAIVIGTGAGGLSAAAYLAKYGWETVALEQSDHVGGLLAPIQLGGYTFDPGLHYVGMARRGLLLDDVLGELGIDVESLFVEMDPDGFDVYRFPGFEIRACRGLERYRDRLIEAFSRERAALFKLFDLVAHVQASVRAMKDSSRSRWGALGAVRHLPILMRWSRATFGQLLATLITDPKARAVVAAAASGDIGLPPGQLSALVGLGVLAHYSEGGFFPRGGAGALRDALVESATRNGARFRTSAEVVQVLLQDGKVIGVRLADGETLFAEIVVSNVDPTLTFGKLVDRSALPNTLVHKLEQATPSLSTLGIYLGLKRDLRAQGLGAFNLWSYPAWDIDAVYEPILNGRMPEELGFLLSSGTLRDDSGKLAPPGCSTLEVSTFAPWQLFARWAEIPAKERGDDYRRLREQIAERLLSTVERVWPGLVADVEVRRVSTPLSLADYVRAVRGGAYGLAHTVQQAGYRRFRTRTPLDGLYLVGAGVLSAGVVNCLMSGRIAADLALRKATKKPAFSALGVPARVLQR